MKKLNDDDDDDHTHILEVDIRSAAAAAGLMLHQNTHGSRRLLNAWAHSQALYSTDKRSRVRVEAPGSSRGPGF